MNLHHEYPHITARNDALLWSINERLGALLARLCPNADAGGSLDRLEDDWIAQVAEMAIVNKEDADEQYAEMIEQLREQRGYG